MLLQWSGGGIEPRKITLVLSGKHLLSRNPNKVPGAGGSPSRSGSLTPTTSRPLSVFARALTSLPNSFLPPS